MGTFIKTVWNTIMFYPFLNLVFFLYLILGHNMGLAVIAIAIISRILLIPVTKKQNEMNEKMRIMKPRMEALQKKYKGNQEKLSQEQVKLWKEVGYNPVGCFGSTFIQLALLIVIINVINLITKENFTNELSGIYPFIKNFAGDVGPINMKFLGVELNTTYMSLISASDAIPLKGVLLDIPYTILSFLFGSFYVKSALPYLIISILVGLTQYITSMMMQYFQGTKIEEKDSKKKKKDEGELSPEEIQAKSMQSMNKLFPVMSLFFTLTTPAVLGVYWLAQSLMMIVQYFILEREKSLQFFKEYFDKSFMSKLKKLNKTKSK